jgi:dolichol-phosphate mannosyltransferase
MAQPTKVGCGVDGPATRWKSLVDPGARRFGKFLVVGSSGALVNSGALYALHGKAHLPLVAASASATGLAIAHNYVWNDRWTFRRARMSLRRFVRFGLVSLVGLGIAEIVLVVLVTTAMVDYLLANLAGIALATLWNFTANVVWTWGRQA